ncbi:C40 family peptidase [Alkalihalobacillus sp. AL-G]|uniref:C40 family peptidase n=1 Tax=Alkalihalobacillus sp. AL-G TaxID=2926399 RepID=UPI002729C96C|nr:C40 family peptidase [Alkalihalobacillus sp. AL-G]
MKKAILTGALSISLLTASYITEDINITYAQSIQSNIVDIALQYKGTPYSWGGTSPSGFDCSGFALYVFGQAGIDLGRTTDAQWSGGTSVSRSDLVPGDMVFFQNTYKRGISHSGIYIGNNEFIHASSSGIRVSSLSNSYWSPRYLGAKRYVAAELNFDVIHSSQGLLKSFATSSEAINYSKLWRNTKVVNNENENVVWEYPEQTTNFNVVHSSQGVLEGFSTEQDAIAYAKKWMNTVVVNVNSNETVWSWPVAQKASTLSFDVIHSHHGVLETFPSKSEAINYAELWKHTSVVNKETNETIWQFDEMMAASTSVTVFEVIHSSVGVLESFDSKDSAIAYSKKWKNTKVINKETSQVVWVFPEEKFKVVHSHHGTLETFDSKSDAIAYAQKWLNTEVIDGETDQVLWTWTA